MTRSYSNSCRKPFYLCLYRISGFAGAHALHILVTPKGTETILACKGSENGDHYEENPLTPDEAERMLAEYKKMAKSGQPGDNDVRIVTESCPLANLKATHEEGAFNIVCEEGKVTLENVTPGLGHSTPLRNKCEAGLN